MKVENDEENEEDLVTVDFKIWETSNNDGASEEGYESEGYLWNIDPTGYDEYDSDGNWVNVIEIDSDEESDATNKFMDVIDISSDEDEPNDNNEVIYISDDDDDNNENQSNNEVVMVEVKNEIKDKGEGDNVPIPKESNNVENVRKESNSKNEGNGRVGNNGYNYKNEDNGRGRNNGYYFNNESQISDNDYRGFGYTHGYNPDYDNDLYAMDYDEYDSDGAPVYAIEDGELGLNEDNYGIEVLTEPLKNWYSTTGMEASPQEMIRVSGHSPLPVFDHNFVPFQIFREESSLSSSDDLTPLEVRRIVDHLFPIMTNENFDISDYSEVANVINDELTNNNEHVNNDSNNNELMDQEDNEILKELAKQIRHRGDNGPGDDEKLQTINLGSEESPQEVKIGSFFEGEERDKAIALLKEYKDVFAWSYKDMPGLDTEIVEHKIPLIEDSKPVKQKLRRIKPEWSLQVKEEIMKLLKVGFIKVIEHPTWLANIVVIIKSNGKIRICVDFRDLNKASPKDDFPLPNIDMLVDSTASYKVKSFVDGFAGYNQIRMAEEDQHKTAFTTPWGTFCYTVMPFGLKNAGATYQRAVTTLFHDMIHKEIEVYVDDMIIHSTDEEGKHLADLTKFFERLREHKMRLNPAKCVFGVIKGKVLGYMVTDRGIEVDPSKVKAITEMPPPRTQKEVKGFMGRLQYISRFVNQLTTMCEPIFKLLKKNAKLEWNEKCQLAFEEVKHYLTCPPVLVPPHKSKPLILYLTVMDEALGAMLAQEQPDSKKENAIYFVSRRFQGSEINYSALEKSCAALVWVAQRLKHYLETFPIRLVSRMDPMKYIFEKPFMSSRIAKWYFLLADYDITYITQKSIRGRVFSDQLAEFPSNEVKGEDPQFPDEDLMIIDMEEENDEKWKLFFDGAANKNGFGIGMLLVDPRDIYTPLAIRLEFDSTNNTAEYEACIAGLEAALERNVEEIEVYGDSLLIINQVQNRWKILDPTLQKYHTYLQELVRYFKTVTFHYLPREKNRFADALATLASLVEFPEGKEVKPFRILKRVTPAFYNYMDLKEFRESKLCGAIANDGNEWYYDIWVYLERQGYPEGSDKKRQMAIRNLAAQYVIMGERLYKRHYQGINLLCAKESEKAEIMRQIHEGICGPHMSGHMLAKKIIRQGYYWTTLDADCVKWVRECDRCQRHANLQHMPPRELYNMTTPWPFSTWGIDVIGKVHPIGTNGHCFILVAIDYFTKWVEAASYKVLNAKKVAIFIENNIISRYGVPHEIISDNGSHFEKEADQIMKRYKITRHQSSPYRPQTNGAVEAANKTIETIIKKITDNGKDWPDKLPLALWGYRTSVRTATGETPYSLVYGMEAVLPIELEIPSIRVLLENQINEVDWLRSRYDVGVCALG